MTREEFKDYVDVLRSQNEISYNVYSALIDGIDTLEQEPCDYYDTYNKTCRRSEVPKELCEDAISRQSVKRKLQEHHDFFINAYNGFNNMPLHDKSRVEEISNCIAMVVNEPSVTSKKKRTETHACDYMRKKTKKPEEQPSGFFIPRTAERTPWNPGKKHDRYIIPSKREKTRKKKTGAEAPDFNI